MYAVFWSPAPDQAVYGSTLGFVDTFQQVAERSVYARRTHAIIYVVLCPVSLHFQTAFYNSGIDIAVYYEMCRSSLYAERHIGDTFFVAHDKSFRNNSFSMQQNVYFSITNLVLSLFFSEPCA